jgi:hypothetical protein
MSPAGAEAQELLTCVDRKKALNRESQLQLTI